MLSAAAAAPGGRRAARGAAASPLLTALRSNDRAAPHAASPGGRDLRLAQQPGVENTHDGKAKSSDANAKQTDREERDARWPRPSWIGRVDGKCDATLVRPDTRGSE